MFGCAEKYTEQSTHCAMHCNGEEMVFHQLWISPLLLTLSVDPDWESKSFVSLLILRHSPKHHRTAMFNGFQWMPSDDFNGDLV